MCIIVDSRRRRSVEYLIRLRDGRRKHSKPVLSYSRQQVLMAVQLELPGEEDLSLRAIVEAQMAMRSRRV